MKTKKDKITLEKNKVEIEQVVNPDGRRRVKLVLHEIYPDETHCNLNGITYLEEYCKKCGDSIIGMPICASFFDEDKDVPYDHGLTGQMDGMPLFEDSVQVGTADGWDIEDIDIDGQTKHVMVAIGYINQQRYPNFVSWLEQRQSNKETVYGSVEFVGRDKEHGIIYKDGKTQNDKYRVPIDYTYSGYCLLTVRPADSTAVMLELNQAKNKILEDKKMDAEIKTALDNITKSVGEVNEYKKTLEENKKTISEKDGSIAKLTKELNACKEESNAKDSKISDLQKQIDDMKAEQAKAKSESAKKEMNEALKGYSDKAKAVVKNELEAFEKDPIGSKVTVNSVCEKMDAAMYRDMKKKAQNTETNASHFEDIFSGIETNSETKGEEVNIEDCFG